MARLDDAASPKNMNDSGLHFHALSGNMKGRYSVRLTANWRMTFGWQSDNAVDVDLEDCH